MRTQEEILARYKEVEDSYNIQRQVLSDFMQYEYRVMVTPDLYDGWFPLTDAKEDIINYLKAVKEGYFHLSNKIILRLKTWIWLDDEEFYNQLDWTSYNWFSLIDKISEYYRV